MALPALELEALVTSLIRKHLHVPTVQANVVTEATTEEIASVVRQLTELSNAESRTDEKKSRALLGLIENVQITPGWIRISIMAKAIAKHLAVEQKRICNDHLNIEADFRHRKRGVETKLILADAIGTRDETLFRNIALSHRYFNLNQSGKTYAEIAEAEGTSKRRIQQLVELAFLAPDIIRGVWEGAQPVGLTSHWLKTHSFSPIWNEQRELFKTL
jgi:site-specific DNA recombinase